MRGSSGGTRHHDLIAALDLTRSTQNAMWLITWNPTQPVATCPLAIQQSGTWYTYGIDLPKNITSTGNATQPIQWSSEFTDTDLGMVYYNYRHYNPLDGRWTGRDIELKTINMHLYSYVNDAPILTHDVLGDFAAPAIAITAGLTITAPVLLGVLTAVFIVGAIVYVATRKCPACPPPTQQPGSRLDCVPPSRPHYPCEGSHLHSWVFVMHQNPITCRCFEKEEETVTCL